MLALRADTRAGLIRNACIHGSLAAKFFGAAAISISGAISNSMLDLRSMLPWFVSGGVMSRKSVISFWFSASRQRC